SFLRPTLTSFRRENPDITVSITDGSSSKVEKIILNGEADFGICSRLYNYKELNYIPLMHDEFGVIFTNEHPLAVTSGPLTWSGLKKYQYIKLSSDTGIGAFLEDKAASEFGVDVSQGDIVSSTNALYAMLGMGGRISVVPALAAHAHPLNEFKFRTLVEPVVSREICVVTRPLLATSPGAEKLLSVLMDAITEFNGADGVRIVPRHTD